MGVILNIGVICIFYWALEMFTMNPKFIPVLHYVLLWMSVCFLILVLPSFMLSVTLNPGIITKKIDFISLIDKAFETDVNFEEAFCSYCEIIKTESSFHCQ